MHTVGTQLTHVWRTKPSGYIGTQVDVVCHIEHCSQATRDTIEMTTEILKTYLIIFHEPLTMQLTTIGTQSTRDVPTSPLLACCSIQSDIIKVIGWDKVFLSLVK